MHTTGDLVFAVTGLLTKKTCEWHKEEVSVVCGAVRWDLRNRTKYLYTYPSVELFFMHTCSNSWQQYTAQHTRPNHT